MPSQGVFGRPTTQAWIQDHSLDLGTGLALVGLLILLVCAHYVKHQDAAEAAAREKLSRRV